MNVDKKSCLSLWANARASLQENLYGHPASGLKEATLIITFNEVSHHHGTGVLIKRLFAEEKNVLHLRSATTYPCNDFGAVNWLVNHSGRPEREIMSTLATLLAQHEIKRILCVPFSSCDLHSALAAQEICGVPLCLYVMDDQNIYTPGIPDHLMRRALQRADLVFAISPEMRDAYEQKFGDKIWILPPTVHSSSTPTHQQTVPRDSHRGVLVGNIWSKERLEQLLALLKDSGLHVDWFSNGALKFPHHTPESLQASGLHPQGHLEESRLIVRLREYAYSLVLAGSPGQDKDITWLSALSLPSRLPFVVAAGELPVLAVGEANTPVGNFVSRFNVGVISPPNAASLKNAASLLCQPDQQHIFRESAKTIAPLFESRGIATWIWESLDKGQPIDARFEKAFARLPSNTTAWIDTPVSQDVFWQFRPLYKAMERLRHRDYRPDFILDVGCSTGVWSHTVRPLFPHARFILVDPLLQNYRQLNSWYYEQNPDFESFEMALGEGSGVVEFKVSDDLYGSSLLDLEDGRSYQKREVQLTTIDQFLVQAKAQGKGILKIDVQSAEHLVLAGAQKSLFRFDFIIIELSLQKFTPEGKTFLEMVNFMQEQGFVYHDDAGDWRSPQDGRLIQKDVIFRLASACST
jgi:FkbM family methyltransferase